MKLHIITESRVQVPWDLLGISAQRWGLEIWTLGAVKCISLSSATMVEHLEAVFYIFLVETMRTESHICCLSLAKLLCK